MTSSPVVLSDVERLSSRLIRVLGGNPGKFTLQGTNTYLVGTGRERILIDTGEGKPAWGSTLRSVLESENASIRTALITHWHQDHVGGIPDVLKICSSAQVYKNQASGVEKELEDGQRFQVEGATVTAFFTPGHASDHMAFILEEEDAMFAGDNVLGHGTAVFEDLAEYLDSLEKMRSRFKGRIYPGHGPVVEDGPGKILQYIKHRQEREEQIISVLNGSVQASDEKNRQTGMTSMQIVKIIYKDVREDLHSPAERGVLQVLYKLEEEGRVVRSSKDDTWTLLKASL